MRRRRDELSNEATDDVIDLTVLEQVAVTDDAPFVGHLRRWTRDGRPEPREEAETERPADPWRTPSSWPISRQIGRVKRER